jgi:outer membrane murein-binding lipoprotein Lpp
MRKAIYLLAILSAGLFIYSLFQFNVRSELQLPALGEVKGFEDVNKTDDFTRLVERFKQKISDHKAKAASHQTVFFWMSLLVTALTAGSTLISSFQAAKKEEPATDPKQLRKFTVVIAILAFCSTLTNTLATHYNDVKTEQTKLAVELSTMRTQFYADYEKAAPENKPTVIRTYNERLD